MIENWKQDITETINSKKYYGFEMGGLFRFYISLVKIKKMNVYIWGNKENVESMVKFLENEGLNIKGIICTNESSIGDILGISVISQRKFESECEKYNNVFVFIYDMPIVKNPREFRFRVIRKLYKIVSKGGSYEHYRRDKILKKISVEFYMLTEKEKAALCQISSHEFDDDRITFYQNNAGEIVSTLDYYNDEETFSVINEYLRSYIEKDVYKKEQLPFRYKYFYGEKGKMLYKQKENEVWVNLGACSGDTISVYLCSEPSFDQIIAVEGDSVVFDELEKNIQKLPENMRTKITCKKIYVDNETNERDLLGGKTVTLINADIEGAELSALKSLSKVIKRDMPVLAICIYHKKEDIIEIPKYIKSLSNEYVLMIRKYVPAWGNVNREQELVLYAIPPERIL